MVRAVLTVLVVAGFFITGDIPSVITRCQQGLMAVQNHAQSMCWPTESTISLGRGEHEQQHRLDKDVTSGMTGSVSPSWERLPPEAIRSIDQRDLVAGSRLVLWLVKKDTVSATQVDVIDPQTGEVLLTPKDAPSCSPKRGRIDMNALREGGEVSVRYNHKQQSHFRNSGTVAQHEPLGAVLGIEHNCSGQK
tara:strand:- start:44 stop:619 length:576 start_codon:yes stop_codon:yes gene_type:complete